MRRPLDGYRLELKFNNGARECSRLEDVAFFQQVRLGMEAGTIEWPNGVDLCPDVLYSRVTGIPITFAEREASARSRHKREQTGREPYDDGTSLVQFHCG